MDSSFRGLIETIAEKGRFCSLYTDRGSHYFHAPEAGGKVAPGAITQVGRALAQIGDRAYRGLLARGARAVGARFPHLAGSPAQGAGACRRQGHRDGQRLHPGSLSAGPQRPLRREAGRGAKRRRAGRAGAMARPPVRSRSRGAGRGAGQHGSPGTACKSRLIRRAPTSVRAKLRVHTYPDGEIAIFHGPRCLVRWLPDQEDKTIPLSSAA